MGGCSSAFAFGKQTAGAFAFRRFNMKTGILVHGFHLYSQNWQRIVWGDAPQNLGRLPQGLLTAHSMNADVIVLGTGASKRQFPYPESERCGEQLTECEFTLEYLKTFFDDILLFEPWARRGLQCNDQLSWQAYKADILSKIKLDFESENTVEELKNAGEIFLSNEVDRVMLVSSPTPVSYTHLTLPTIYSV